MHADGQWFQLVCSLRPTTRRDTASLVEFDLDRDRDGSRFPKDPARPGASLKTAWNNARKKAGVSGQWHDNRHTLIAELAENGVGDETIMEIAGHVSRQMLSRYAHIRTEAKRKALEEVERKRAAGRR